MDIDLDLPPDPFQSKVVTFSHELSFEEEEDDAEWGEGDSLPALQAEDA